MSLTHTAEIHRLVHPANPHRDFGLRILARHGALSDDDEQAAHLALTAAQTMRPGAELIAEGETLTTPRLMLEGWATRQRVLRDGRRQICGFVLPGEVFGLCTRPHGLALYGTVALTPVTMARMPMLAEAMHSSSGSAAGTMAWDMVTREEMHLINQVVRLGRQAAHERLIHLLLEFHDRLSRAGLVEKDSFQMPFTQEVLADALGLSVVHTNRMLQQLRRENLIVTGGGHVSLQDMNRLTKIADYTSIEPG